MIIPSSGLLVHSQDIFFLFIDEQKGSVLLQYEMKQAVTSPR